MLVTGDIVLDCHLYGGVKTVATSFKEPGTEYKEDLGGAVLTRELLLAAHEEMGLAWDRAERVWKEDNEKRVAKGEKPQPRPKDLPEECPEFGIHLDLDDSGLPQTLPSHLCSYGVWTDQPTQEDSQEKGRVWRVGRHFGYGPTEATAPGTVFKKSTTAPVDPITLTLIDDGGILFRHRAAENVWPKFSTMKCKHYLFKMSSPLCCGALWERLAEVMDRLTVVISAEDLRREDVQINSRLSWERCAEHTIRALRQDPHTRHLLNAANVIISFRSAGALWVERLEKNKFNFRLLFDPDMLEGDYSLKFSGSTYGFQTCLTAGIAHHLMQNCAKAECKKKPACIPARCPFEDRRAYENAILPGIAAGLKARRRLLELGHGSVGEDKPGFPIKKLGKAIAASPAGYVSVVAQDSWGAPSECQWTILSHAEAPPHLPAPKPTKLTGIAHLTARYGFRALSHVPALRMGKLFTVDRSEIESFRTLESLIRAYESVKVQKRPLSIGVFGPPGAGKSFGVKALTRSILGKDVPFLEFNLSQFKSPDELVGAFHRVRDAVLEGITPVAFWDEFDSHEYKWLQYLLAPMQDGAFQEGQITHPIGKCIFMFAGGTSDTFGEFGVKPPRLKSREDIGIIEPNASPERKKELLEELKRYQDYKLLKGPDFMSRLHGFLDVLGPNPARKPNCDDITYPIRRAIILRSMLGLKDYDELDIDRGLLIALLVGPEYCHGARSFEKIVNALAQDCQEGRLQRSALPPPALLGCETCAEEFLALLHKCDAFKGHPDLESLAAAVHYNYLDGARKADLEAQMKEDPGLAWAVHPSIWREFESLAPDIQASNRAAARRIPDHLALIGFAVERQQEGETGTWKEELATAIEAKVELLAQAEHLGWWSERVASGWTYSEDRKDDLKRHPLLISWSRVSPANKEKDRNSVRAIPGLLDIAKCKAIPVPGLTGE